MNEAARVGRLEDDAPVLAACCYCRSVRPASGELAGSWVTLERYRELGGTEQVRVSHGICPRCYEEQVQPLLDEYEEAEMEEAARAA